MHTTGADIQIDDGNFVRLHNAILEVLAVARFTASEFRAVCFLLRKTYGYNKKSDELSLAQWAEGTNTDKGQIKRTIDSLIAKNVIRRSPSQRPYCHTYEFNKYMETWDERLFERNASMIHPRQTEADEGAREEDEKLTVRSKIDPPVNEKIDRTVNKKLTVRSKIDPPVNEKIDRTVNGSDEKIDRTVNKPLTVRSTTKNNIKTTTTTGDRILVVTRVVVVVVVVVCRGSEIQRTGVCVRSTRTISVS
ncbi:MAG: hypothetical protein KatS3mg051_1045 [Anaerolineae bacterium]|nr:MAG: hypothetical protein KatS3mg051_1045 [Anaerolineae bacterium]